jgi:hypothetical protein
VRESAPAGRVPWDHFGITCVRGLSPDEVLSRPGVDDHGVLLQTPVLTRLSVGTEAVSIRSLLDGTTRNAHARPGELLAYYDAWHFQPPAGADPSFLHRALTDAGFFLEEDRESDDWDPSTAGLHTLEREFGLTLSPEAARSPQPTVGLLHLRG